MLIAALPMYDLPELRESTDAFWSCIAARLRDRGIAAPEALTREADLHAIWTDPRLLLAQTCGYPLVTSLAGRVRLVTTPCYAAQGCDGPLYRSAVVVRDSDRAHDIPHLRGRRCAVNDMASNSGWHALRRGLPDAERFFGEIVLTGSHLASMDAVSQGRADVAAIDCVTWAHAQRWRPASARGLRVLGWTAASPGLPLITSQRTDDATRGTLLDALSAQLRDAAFATAKELLLLDGFRELTLADYMAGLDVGPGTQSLSRNPASSTHH